MGLPTSTLMKSVRQIPTITICTDASYDKDLGVGTWACYIKTDKQTIKTGKVIETHINNSSEAERIGVANALYLANRIVELKVTKLVFYCDNMSALKPIRLVNKSGAIKARAKEQSEFYQKNIEPYLSKTMLLDLRHVKGHIDRSPRLRPKTKHYMNDWCDKEAHRLLKEYRKSIDLKSNL